MKSTLRITQFSIFLFISSMLVSVSTPTMREQIIGKWAMFKMVSDSKVKKKKAEGLFFKEDGSLYSFKIKNEESMKLVGKWDVDEENSVLIVRELRGGEDEVDILKLTSKKMVFSKGENKEIHLKRLK